MGILRSGLLGPFQKKIGSVIGRRHRKQNVITALHTTSHKPFSAAQQDSQFKLGLLNGFLSDIDQLVNMGFKALTKNNSPVNEAFSYNYNHAFVKNGDAFLIDYPKIVYSRGHIVIPEHPQVIFTAGQITFSWLLQKQSAYCQFTDRASFLVYNFSKKRYIIQLNVTSRSAQRHSIEIPPANMGDTFHCYMSFASADGKKNGDSVYVGVI